MSFVSLLKAVTYREVVFFKRWLSEYLVIWFIPLMFSLAVVFLPTTIFEERAVVQRISDVIGVELSLRQIIVYSLAISAILSVTLSVIDTIINTLYHEKHSVGTLQMVLEATSLKAYLVALSIVRPPLLTILSTLYLAIVLPLAAGFSGIITYLLLLPALVISGIALGVYALIIAIPIVFYTKIGRPWTIPNTLIPALLAGSGLYIPIHLVPIVIRWIAYTAPIPHECEAVKIIALKGFAPQLFLPMTLITVLFAVYLSISSPLAYLADKRVRRHG